MWGQYQKPPLFAVPDLDPPEPERREKTSAENAAAVSSARSEGPTADEKNGDHGPNADRRAEVASAPARVSGATVSSEGDPSTESPEVVEALPAAIHRQATEKPRGRRVLLRTDSEPVAWREAEESSPVSIASETSRHATVKTLYSALIAAALIGAGALAGASLSEKPGAEAAGAAGNGASSTDSQPGPAARDMESRKTAAPAASPASKRESTRIESVPAGAELIHEGAVEGNTPIDIERPAYEQLYLLRLEGYRSQLVRIGPRSVSTIRVTLKRSEPAERDTPR